LCQHLFLGKVLPLDDKREGNVNPAKHFLREKMAQSLHIRREKKNCQIQTIASSKLPKYNGVPKRLDFSVRLYCSQNCLKSSCGWSASLHMITKLQNKKRALCTRHLSTLANSTLIILLFSKNVEIFKNYFFQMKKYCERK
jgi:hypothetical protein